MTASQGELTVGSQTSHATRLGADGNFLVAPGVMDWAESTAAAVYRCLGTRDLSMDLRAYRHQGLPHLACDLCPADDGGALYPMTFTTGGLRDLDLKEPCVADLVEALFMAGVLAERLGARAVIDVALG